MAGVLTVQLLGDVRLLYDDKPIAGMNTARLQSLLAYLILHRGAPQNRRHLAFVLWPDSSEAQALTNLRHVLHTLRHTLPNADLFVAAETQTVQWRPDAPATVDVAEFEAGVRQAASTAELQRAVDRYQGELLPGFYDDWVLPVRDRLYNAYVAAIERVIEALEEERAYKSAIAYAQRLLETDPLREETYRRLIRLHALNGDRAAALHVYHACATVLCRELDVDPSPATQEMYKRLQAAPLGPDGSLLAHRAGPEPGSRGDTPRGPGPFPGRPALVGRREEWARLQAAWRQAAAGQSQLVLLTGEPGTGKTRLAEELVDWAARQGITAAIARCYEAEGGLAYAPVAAWLRARPLPPLKDVWLAEIARLLPEVLAGRPKLRPAGPLHEDWQRQRLFEALAHAVLDGRQPILMLIDDLQWCDWDTIEWLHYLLRFDARARLLVVGTLRAEEVGDAHPAARLLAGLRRNDRVVEIPLSPLAEGDTRSLASQVAGRDLDGVWGELLHQASEGNPLFLVEMIRAALGVGRTWDMEHGRAMMQARLLLPDKVRQVIETRLAQLSPTAAALVSVAATAGRAFTFEVVHRASGNDEEALVQALDELWRRRIVREQGGNAYDFSHAKIREVAYANLSAGRRRLLHRHVAEALEEINAGDLDAVAGEVAAHYQQAGLAEQAMGYYQRAGDVARRLYANVEAADFYRSGVELLARLPGESSRAAPLFERLGDTLALLGRAADAQEAYRRGADYAQGDRIGRARLYRKLGATLTGEYRREESDEAFSQANAALGPAPAGPEPEWWQEWVQIRLERVTRAYWFGEEEALARTVAEVKPAVERHGTRVQQAEFFAGLSRQGFRRERFCVSSETAGYARMALEIAGELDDEALLAYREFGYGFALLWNGELNEGEGHLCAALAMAERLGHSLLQVQALAYLAILERRRGRVGEVRRLAERCLAAAERIGRQDYLGLALGNKAWVAWKGGDLREAEAAGHEALRAWDRRMNTPLRWTALWPLLAAALAAGQVAAAIGHAEALLDPAQMCLPDPVAAALEAAQAAWRRDDPASAAGNLRAAAGLAGEAGLL